ncbi:MAG: S41 family peptidase [Acutalibacteraceae bacterium]|jgi:carboxyl-terminal processing protease
MNKKISLGVAISLIIVSIAVSFSATMAFAQKTYNKLIPSLSDRLDRRYALDEIEEIINSNFFSNDKVNKQVLNEKIANGYIQGLEEENCRYLTPREYADYQNSVEGKINGIGIITNKNAADGTMTVMNVAPGSPADREGMARGDVIVSIENEKLTPDNYDILAPKLQSTTLKSVTLSYVRDKQTKTVSVLIGYDLRSVTFDSYGHIGHIKIRSFNKTTPEQLKSAIKELKSKNVNFLIFDVRGTREGTIEYAAKTADVLVPVATEGTMAIATARDRDGNVHSTFPSDSDEINLPMAVLVDDGTSGGAELFAISLRDFKRAPIVGERTAGNNTMQELFKLKTGGALLITVAEVTPYLSPAYNGGIIPDMEVEMPPEQKRNLDNLDKDNDPQLMAVINNYTIAEEDQ